MQNQLPPGISIVKTENFEEWEMDIRVLDSNPLYLDQIYRLRFHFSKSYPIGALPTPLIHIYIRVYKLTLFLAITNRSSRSPIHPTTPNITHPAPDPNTSSHIQQRHHMSRPPRLSWLVTRTDRRECLHEHPEHVNGQLKKRTTSR